MRMVCAVIEIPVAYLLDPGGTYGLLLKYAVLVHKMGPFCKKVTVVGL
jgi:hypothetical protein